MALHGEMERAGLPEDVFTLASLVTAAEKAGRWADALQHVEDFREVRAVHAARAVPVPLCVCYERALCQSLDLLVL